MQKTGGRKPRSPGAKASESMMLHGLRGGKGAVSTLEALVRQESSLQEAEECWEGKTEKQRAPCLSKQHAAGQRTGDQEKGPLSGG